VTVKTRFVPYQPGNESQASAPSKEDLPYRWRRRAHPEAYEFSDVWLAYYHAKTRCKKCKAYYIERDKDATTC